MILGIVKYVTKNDPIKINIAVSRKFNSMIDFENMVKVEKVFRLKFNS
ncbi:hypothetical protein IWQ47_002988 [Aquimarina sp. EL_43]|nr:hypothetical protein [Aquimarina sp. EL_35]MBG6152153.1 hypothetical protein [Aquimarina sp. EL_32]MBG6169903.1 hypothetical protein [Aquimarina sp. EL_43]